VQVQITKTGFESGLEKKLVIDQIVRFQKCALFSVDRQNSGIGSNVPQLLDEIFR
jgi:hypothetical protein